MLFFIPLAVVACTSTPTPAAIRVSSTTTTTSTTASSTTTVPLGTTVVAATPNTTTAATAATCRQYRPEVRGKLPAALTELSGWALSKRHANVLWGHNDSGDGARLIAVSAVDGSLVGEVDVTGSPSADWEDVATYADKQGQSWIVVADVGDNAARRRSVSLVLIPEPDLATKSVAAAGTVTVTWADGPHDVETLIVDPMSGDATLIGKRYTGSPQVSVDRIPAASLVPGASITSEKLGWFTVPSGEQYGPTAGSIDAAGSTIGLVFYNRTMWWTRSPGTSVADTILRSEPCTISSGLGQYESIAIADDGAILIATEGRTVPLVALVASAS